MLTVRRLGSLLALVLVLGTMRLFDTTVAFADGGGTDVSTCQMWICTKVETRGNTSHSGNTGNSGDSSSHSSDGSSQRTDCSDDDSSTKPRCHIDGAGDYSEGCYIQLADPQPPAGDPAWEGHSPGDGAIYERNCGGDGRTQGFPNDNSRTGAIWMKNPPPGVPRMPTAAELAQQAFSKMKLDVPKLGSAPPPGSKGLIGMPVWMWVEKSETTWGPQSTTASAGGLSVTATAKVTGITWTMGDGNTVTCTSPGTPYDPSMGKKDSPDCGYRYTKVGEYQVTATTTWVVTWTATNGETGALPNQTRSAQTQARVGELQVVN
ncbi:ATP-binding protein [Streptomyces sp. NPDC020667]|uniref:ATP-binding protein n=1 Tax=Streptomyces sp. NPDC020667 TaxID=3154895 RepID=UPI0034102A25